MIINCRTEWSQKFEKLVQIYRTGTEGDEDSEDESRSILSQPSKGPAFPPRGSSDTNKNETRPSPPPPAPSSPTSSVAADSRASYNNKSHQETPHAPVLATKTTVSESLSTALPSTCNCSSVQVSSHPSVETSNMSLRSSSPKLNHQKVNPPSVCSTQVKQTPPSSLLHKQNLNAQTTAASKLKGNAGVTTINNLYTNPAQRSSVAIKPPHAPPGRPEEAAKEPIVNGHLKSNSSPRQCSAKPMPQLSSSSTSGCDNQKAKVVKGVETWC